MELLGPTIAELFNFCDKRFKMKTICWVALEMISRIESLHSKGLIHRDIKPENFLIKEWNGKKQPMLYIIDFGLSKRFISP